MYDSLHAKTGVESATDWVNKFVVQQGPDGLTLIPPSDEATTLKDLKISGRLHQWLRDLRLLRHMPLSYLVADVNLLPPESIRFFHLDPTWVDRLIDGVFSAANTGSVDSTFSYALLLAVRNQLDDDLKALADDELKPLEGKDVKVQSWVAKEGRITGMLIRSELVRRWPNMIVEPYADLAATTRLATLRREPISRDIYIALFAGVPVRVDVREPNVGVRFGVEPKKALLPASFDFQVDARGEDGGNSEDPPIGVKLKCPKPQRVLNIDDLATRIGKSARMVALHLEQRPSIQTFSQPPAESRGWVPLDQMRNSDGTLKDFVLTKGHVLKLTKHAARLAAMKLTGKA